MKKTTISLFLIILGLIMLPLGVMAQTLFEVPGFYATVEAACEAIETEVSITEAIIQVAAGTVVEADDFEGWSRTVKVTIQGAGADKTFIESFSGHRPYPGEPDANGTKFLSLTQDIPDIEVIIKDITFRWFGRGDNENAGFIATSTNKSQNLKISLINCVFDSLSAKQGAIYMGVDDTHELYMENCLVTGCLAYGGSAFSGMINKEHGGKVTIKNCTFMNNESFPYDHRSIADSIDKAVASGSVIRVQDGEGDLPLVFILENTAFINNHPLPVARDTTYPAVQINIANVATTVELKDNIFIGNQRDGYPDDVDLIVPSNELITYTNSGNILNSVVGKSYTIVDTTLDGCKIYAGYTYTHPDINFTMDGELPKLIPDANAIGHVEYTGDGGDPEVSVHNLRVIDVNVYPNPSSGRFEIVMPEQIRRANYEVYSVAGNRIRTGSLYSGYTSLDMTDAAKGIYILKISSDTQVGMKRLVIK